MGRRHEQTFLQRRHPDAQQTHERVLIITYCQKNTNQNYNETNTSHRSEWLNSKPEETTGLGKDLEKKEPWVYCRRECKLVQILWKTYGGSSESEKQKCPTIQQSHYWYLPKEYKNTNQKYCSEGTHTLLCSQQHYLQ